jgi:hypothetical protein
MSEPEIKGGRNRGGESSCRPRPCVRCLPRRNQQELQRLCRLPKLGICIGLGCVADNANRPKHSRCQPL